MTPSRASGCLTGAPANRLSAQLQVTPLEQVGIALAILWGNLVFSQWPGLGTRPAMALVCGAGQAAEAREQTGRKEDA